MAHALTILIPAYNEERTIKQLLALVEKMDVSRAGLSKEIIVIDDGSTDNTRRFIRETQQQFPDIILLHHERNQGKGAAIKTVLSRATGDIIIIQDADLELDPQDILRCVQPILDGKAVVVYGSRRLQKQKTRANMLYLIGGIMVTKFFNLLYHQHLTDIPTCYKAFRADILKRITIEGNRFEWEPEVSAKVTKMGISITEVPISYYPRTAKEGKKLRWKDGLYALWTLLKYRVKT
ncbi:MAG: glycosyl transferase family 2 [Parcubacteria group bacterium Greene0714_36]|nr:MAG: glycosyl transferase family 2 [Parcubacteria group bacterium Greene0714_36]